MARLRRDCPWDAEQTPRSLAKHLIEETAETVDAIESGSDADLVEELGDVLLQVVFHAEIAREEGR
ncbi:MAG: nucleoside triphosphate pyrophosphohydrolase, partial [Propionibacteriaceae bacterium]|nr:nucleoside triphosphate pyrophosphohydrolase [Propionibacteriaceae bacterium]